MLRCFVKAPENLRWWLPYLDHLRETRPSNIPVRNEREKESLDARDPVEVRAYCKPVDEMRDETYRQYYVADESSVIYSEFSKVSAEGVWHALQIGSTRQARQANVSSLLQAIYS